MKLAYPKCIQYTDTSKNAWRVIKKPSDRPTQTAAVRSMPENHNPQWKRDSRMFSPFLQPTHDGLLIWQKRQQKGILQPNVFNWKPETTSSCHLHPEKKTLSTKSFHNALIRPCPVVPNRDRVLVFCDGEATIVLLNVFTQMYLDYHSVWLA